MALMNKFLKWKSVSEQLRGLRTLEKSMRIKLAAEVFNYSTLPGTKKIRYENCIVKATNKQNVNVDKEALMSVWSELTKEDKAAFNMVPTLSMTALNALPKDSLVHDVVELKPGTPTLEVTEIVEI